MADEEQLRILKQGVEAWNAWRAGWEIAIDLSEAPLDRDNLSEADLDRVNLALAKLRDANLRETNLIEADLHWARLDRADLREAFLNRANLSLAHLGDADLSGAHLDGADLRGADLAGATLRGAGLRGANLAGATLRGADFDEAQLFETVLSNVDLRACKNLETIVHHGPSTIDIRTLQRSGPLPLTFRRGVGLPDAFIEYLPSLLNQAIQFYSCFISYSSKDGDFAHRLHADLQNNGVRCWFAPHDMKIGAKIRDTLDEAIRLRDKVLLVLSEASIASGWVEDEVDKAFEEEGQRDGVVLFPVRLDDAVMETREAWAAKLRRSRNIGDFRGWKNHDAYQTAFKRVLRDLQIDIAPDAA
jgi:hypothetical protein